VQRCAGVGTSYGPSLCLCLSQVGILSKRLNELGWFLAWKLVSTYPILCFMDIQVPSKISLLSPGTLLRTKRVINVAREMWTLGT